MAVCLLFSLPMLSNECQPSSQQSLPACRGWKDAPGKQASNRAPCRVFTILRKLLQAARVPHTHTICTHTFSMYSLQCSVCQQEHINPLRKYLEGDYVWACKKHRNQPPSSILHVPSLTICVKHFLAFLPDNHSCQWVKEILLCQVARAM